MNNNEVFDGVTVIGAGLTGLSAAYALVKQGIAVRLYEQNRYAGGRTYSLKQDGFVFDLGAITLLPTYTESYKLINELNLQSALSSIQPKIGVERDGVIHSIDLAHPIKSMLSTKLLPITAKLSALRLAKDVINTWSKASFDTLSTLAGYDKVSVAEQLERSLHPDILNYLADPIIGGNTLNSCSRAPYGELLWMLRQYAAPYLCGLEGGINTLAEALAQRLPITYQHQAVSVSPAAEGIRIDLLHQGQPQVVHSRYCLLALPPPQLEGFASAMSAEQHQFFKGLTALPSISLHLGLKQKTTRSETFILPPSCENPIVATLVQDHLKAPGRAALDKGVLTVFCRADYARYNAHLSDDELKDILIEQTFRYFGEIKDQIESVHLQRWPYAIIQSDIGLHQRIADFEWLPEFNPNILISGDYLSMGMEAAVRAGNKAAQILTAKINSALN